MADFIEDIINPDDDTKNKKKSKVIKKRNTSNLSREEKEKIKADKKVLKSRIKQKKAEEKAFKKSANEQTEEDLYDSLTDTKKETVAEKEKYAKEGKTKTPKEAKNIALYMREWPIKMLKEGQKIKCPSKKEIGFKFLWVVLFVVIFGAIFYFVDWGISLLFTYLDIIK